MRSEVVTAVIVRSLNMEASRYSETSVNFCQTARRFITKFSIHQYNAYFVTNKSFLVDMSRNIQLIIIYNNIVITTSIVIQFGEVHL
jgi:hypothetical protein